MADRGKIVSLKVTVRYPDGSSKETTVDPSGLSALYFDETAMPAEARELFASSINWKDNPTFVEKRGDVMSPRCKIDQCPIPG